MWSPNNNPWLNAEVIAYVYVESVTDCDASAAPATRASQLYVRGGHHTSSNGCMGSTYRSRFRYDRRVACRKEICHSDYASPDQAEKLAGTIPDGRGRCLGLKFVVYNTNSAGQPTTSASPAVGAGVKEEMYVDVNAGNASIPNINNQNWIKVTEYRDQIVRFVNGIPESDWASSGNTYRDACGIPDGHVIYDGHAISSWTDSDTGHTHSNANLGALRFDCTTAMFTFFSVREIEPSQRLL
jgi:hypothetical protein